VTLDRSPTATQSLGPAQDVLAHVAKRRRICSAFSKRHRPARLIKVSHVTSVAFSPRGSSVALGLT